MNWEAVRLAHPNRWLIVEALPAQSASNQRRLDQRAIVETCPDGATAFQRYQALHQMSPERELYFVHTAKVQLEILERQWLGIRRAHAPNAFSNQQ